MKNIKVKTLTYEMMSALSRKKNQSDIEKWLEATIKEMYLKK